MCSAEKRNPYSFVSLQHTQVSDERYFFYEPLEVVPESEADLIFVAIKELVLVALSGVIV